MNFGSPVNEYRISENDFKPNEQEMSKLPDGLIESFNKLAFAINKKKKILENYRGIFQLLTNLQVSLTEYKNKHDTMNAQLESLENEKKNLENELNETRQNTPPNTERINYLEEEIASKDAEISRITADYALNKDYIDAIKKLLNETALYIDSMYPTENEDDNDNDNANKLKALINEMQRQISEPSIDISDVHSDNPYGTNNLDINNPLFRLRRGGYRYDSSSNLRRKSRTNSKKSNSSASASSQNKAKKYKKNKNTKKILGGGKRRKMRKTKSKRGSKRGSKHGFKRKH